MEIVKKADRSPISFFRVITKDYNIDQTNMTNHSDKSIELLAFFRAPRKIRKRKKLTQDELSLYSHVDRSYISELENEEKAPTPLTIAALARALHVKASGLIEGYDQDIYGEHRIYMHCMREHVGVVWYLC